jgi:hypothetical protein
MQTHNGSYGHAFRGRHMSAGIHGLVRCVNRQRAKTAEPSVQLGKTFSGSGKGRWRVDSVRSTYLQQTDNKFFIDN